MSEDWEDVKPARVSSGKNTIEVTVDSNHIRRGIRKDIFNDPVSLALKEATQANWAMSGWGYARTGHDNNIQKNWSLWPFATLRDFLRTFDSGKRVSPITFNATFEQSIDKTPKTSNTKPRKRKTFTDQQRKLGLL